MDKKQALIWKYLDRDCSDEEVSTIELLLESDLEFRNELSEARLLHTQLYSTALDPVPHDLTAKVIQRLTVSARSKRYENINAKPLIVFLAFIMIYLIIILISTDLASLEFNRIFDWNIPDYWTQITIPSFGAQGIYIMVSLLIVPVIYMLDQLLQKRRLFKSSFIVVY